MSVQALKQVLANDESIEFVWFVDDEKKREWSYSPSPFHTVKMHRSQVLSIADDLVEHTPDAQEKLLTAYSELQEDHEKIFEENKKLALDLENEKEITNLLQQENGALKSEIALLTAANPDIAAIKAEYDKKIVELETKLSKKKK